MKEYPIEEEFLRPGETLGNNGLCCLSNTNLSLLHIANAIGLGVYITSNGINDKTLRGREEGGGGKRISYLDHHGVNFPPTSVH